MERRKSKRTHENQKHGTDKGSKSTGQTDWGVVNMDKNIYVLDMPDFKPVY